MNHANADHTLRYFPDRMNRIIILILALTVLIVLGCDKEHTTTQTSNRPVIIIGVDTFRGDHLGVAGMKNIQTPNIDALTQDAVYFKNCRSTSPWTGPSFASIFTGLFPYHHGFLGGERLRLDDEHVMIAEYFQAKKDPAAAYVSIGWLTWGCGMAQGYTTGKKVPDLGDGEASLELINMGLEFVRKHRAENFYLFMHFFDAHAPYTPPAPFNEMYYTGNRTAEGELLVDMMQSDRNHPRNDENADLMYDWLADTTDLNYPIQQYAAGVSYVDHMVGKFLTGLKEEGIYESALIVLVGDHGEHLGEHEIFFTHSLPFDEVLHVPLVIKWPENQYAETVVPAAVSTVDVLPTILSITGRRARAKLDGTSLSYLAQKPKRKSRSTILAEEGASPDDFVKALVSGPWKLIAYWTNHEMVATLYNLEDDPGETVDVAAEHPRITKQLLAELGGIINLEAPYVGTTMPRAAEQNEETRKRLRSLGYVQ